MAKVAIVYWSGSGNTEAMAQAIENAAKDAGAETTLSFVSDTTASDVAAFDHIILGCLRRWQWWIPREQTIRILFPAFVVAW